MFKVILLTLSIGACFARPAQTSEEVQQDIDNFKANLQVKYEETKNAGRDGKLNKLILIMNKFN